MTSMNTMPYTTATSSHCRGRDGAFFRMKYSIAAAEKQMKKWSAMPSSTISKPPSRAASPMRQPATPFHGSIHDPPFITRVIDANRKSARPAVKPASSTRFRAWLLVVVTAFIVRLRSVEAETLTPLVRWVHAVRRSLRRIPNVGQPSQFVRQTTFTPYVSSGATLGWVRIANAPGVQTMGHPEHPDTGTSNHRGEDALPSGAG